MAAWNNLEQDASAASRTWKAEKAVEAASPIRTAWTRSPAMRVALARRGSIVVIVTTPRLKADYPIGIVRSLGLIMLHWFRRNLVRRLAFVALGVVMMAVGVGGFVGAASNGALGGLFFAPFAVVGLGTAIFGILHHETPSRRSHGRQRRRNHRA